MVKIKDFKFMKMAIDLSKKGYGTVNPNPLVGAVIVKNGEIIGEGYHEYYGGHHAEINAINNTKESVKEATMYVTLEPCNHYGKTPPCTDRIIKEKFSRVVIGIMDPNKIVIGKGAKKLRQAGILVETGIMEDEINIINEVFIKYITTKQPFCAMKTAMSLDGKISTYTGNSKWISNEKSRKWVHELRHRYSGIMVGVNTIIKDDPDLTDRSDYEIKKHPVRIVLDSNGRTPLNSKILNTSYAKTIIAVTENANSEFIKSVNKNGAKVIICPEKDKRVDLSYLMHELGKQSIDSILLEGGSTLNFSALKEGVVDKIFSFIAPKLIGGDTSKTPVGGLGFDSLEKAISLNIKNIKRFDQDILVEAYII